MGYALQLKTTKSGEWQLILLWFFPIWLRIKCACFSKPSISHKLTLWLVSILCWGIFSIFFPFLALCKKINGPNPKLTEKQWTISHFLYFQDPNFSWSNSESFLHLFIQFFFWNFVVMNLLTWSLGSTFNKMMKWIYMWWWFSTIFFFIKYAALRVLLVN